MTLIRKTILVPVKIGDLIMAPDSIFRADLDLYVCGIKGDMLYIDTEPNTPITECERVFAEDCYLI